MKAKTPAKIREEIEDHKSTIPMIEGQTLLYNIGSRVYGAIGIALPLFLYSQTKSPLCFIGIPLVIDGVGDLITGKHHYPSYRLFKIHPRDEIAKLEAQLKEIE